MGVFTFVCRNSGDEWTGKSLSEDLEASARSTFDLQRKLVHTALSFNSSNGVQSSFSFVTPTSAIFQVIVGAPAAVLLLEAVLLHQLLQEVLHRLLKRRRKRRKRRRKSRVRMKIWDSPSLISTFLQLLSLCRGFTSVNLFCSVLLTY